MSNYEIKSENLSNSERKTVCEEYEKQRNLPSEPKDIKELFVAIDKIIDEEL